MDYIKSYKSFIHSHYVNEGIRITAGILFPAFLMSFFDLLSTGIVISMGALFVSSTDSPGPVHHRKNGMLACTASVFIVALVSGFAEEYSLLLGILLLAACFFFSMIAVYGARATSIGISSLVSLVINIGHQRHGWQNVEYAFLVASGALWYTFFSLLLYNFRPYKLIQQALGDWVQNIAEYLLIRSEFYKKNVDYDDTYKRLLEQQAIVQEKQNMLNELIFKTRSIVKETTHIGRILVMIYLDVTDIFERIMTSYQRYSVLHEYFDETDILEQYHSIAVQMSNELDHIGISLKSGTPSYTNGSLTEKIKQTKLKREELRETYLKPDNIDGFISLRRIIETLQDLAERLETLHKYTTYDKALKKRKQHEVDHKTYISHSEITPQLLKDNLAMKSDIFRHSIRLTIAVMVGYIASLIFRIGHNYWILLTIIVILKPAYSLTKKRNTDRLLGTVAGVITGVLILQAINNNYALLAIMILLMAGSFIFMRQNYFIMVLLMTPYLVLFYHFINPDDFRALLVDRVVDTVIGSAIAFTAIFFLVPSWERQKIKPVMITMLEESLQYFTVISEVFSIGGSSAKQRQQLARKDALVALANLSAAFTRMLSEPKVQQQGIENVHRFVVLNHILTSYMSTLSAYLKVNALEYSSTDFKEVAEDIKHYFTYAIDTLEGKTTTEPLPHKESLRKLNEEADALLEKRRIELQHGQYETVTKNTLFDLKSIVDQFNLIYRAAFEINKISSTFHHLS